MTHPAMFQTLTVGDVCYVTDGAHAKVVRHDKGVLYLTSKNIGIGELLLDNVDFISKEDHARLFADTKTAQRRLRPGDLLIGIIGTFGNAYLYRGTDHFGVSSAVAILRPNKECVLPEYLYYAITSESFRNSHSAYKAGSVQGYTNIPTIKKLPISIPPITEQRRISDVLVGLDERIRICRENCKTLQTLAQAIFKSWFVDFDPVRAKAEGREPECMDADTAALFPTDFEDSDLGEIPLGWKIKPIGDLAAVVGGSTPSTKKAEFWDGEHHWATPKDLSSLTTPILLSTERKITPQGLSQISSGLLDPGTVLMSSRAPIGYLAIAETPTTINQGFIAMKPKDSVSNLFLLFWTRASHEAIVSRANGSTFLEISKSAFRPMPVVTPGPEIIASFDSAVRPLYEGMVNNEKQVRTLTGVRDTLLPRLISGKLRVPEAEKLVEAVQ